jgi:periplasmic protein TonB
MFEQSLVVSQQSTVSSGERWTAFASLSLQIAAVGALITLPLLHPERLVSRVDAPKVTLPSLKMPKPVMVKMQSPTSAAPATSAPKLGVSVVAPSTIPTTIDMRPDSGPALPIIGVVGMPNGLPEGVTSASGSHVRVVAVSAPERKMRVSEGVSAGMLLAPIRPVYPSIARAAGVQGVVVIEATISKAGAIEGLRVMSGPAMLRPAAIEAIQSARYRPYLLNGQPTEVQTTITMNFKMNS